MKRHITIGILSGILALSGATATLAHDDYIAQGINVRGTTSAEIKLQREGARENRDEMRQERQEERRELAGEAKTRIEARVRAFVDRVAERYMAAIERYEKFVVRIESRMLKLEDVGVDTSEAKVHLESAKVKINQASELTGSLDTDTEIIIEAGISRETFAHIKTVLIETKRVLKEAHAELVKSIASLRAARELRADVEVEAGAGTTE